MGDLESFAGHLKQPEYVHVLLNPFPVYGMAAGAFLLLVSLVWRKDPAPALSWLALMGLACWFAVRSGQQGYDRVLAMSNAEAGAWLRVHMHRAESLAFVFYATAGAALAALLARRRWPKLFRCLVWTALLASLVSVNLGGWISQAGGQVRHSEFREGPPRPEQLPDEGHAHPKKEAHPSQAEGEPPPAHLSHGASEGEGER